MIFFAHQPVIGINKEKFSLIYRGAIEVTIIIKVLNIRLVIM
jgi:hypothetical protein